MPTLLILFLLLQPSTPYPTRAEAFGAIGPFESYEVMVDSALVKRDSSSVYKARDAGRWFHPTQDPDKENASLFFLGRDTTLWIQNASGDMITLPAYHAFMAGNRVDEEYNFSDFTETLSGIGWGVGRGRLYIYLTQGIPFWVAAISFGLLVVLIGVAFRRLTLARRRADERRAQLADSRRRIGDSREAERMRIARDLHDGPLQDLQALRMRLGMLQRAASRAAGSDATEPTTDVQDDLLRVVHEIREISENLRPPVLGPFGLAAAVRTLVTRFRALYPAITVDLDLQSDGTTLTDPARLALYRIVQESLNNVAEHAHPQRVQIAYDEAATGARLMISDDGAGFAVPSDLHVLEVAGHLGVAGMDERAESIGAELEVQSIPGQGTTILVHAPASVFSESLLPTTL